MLVAAQPRCGPRSIQSSAPMHTPRGTDNGRRRGRRDRRTLLLGALCALGGCLFLLSVSGQSKKLVTLDDVMSVRSIADVSMSPQGDRVAYVVSTPSLTRNQHVAELFVVPASGGVPKRLAETTRILNTPLPSPKLRWSPDGTRISFLGLAAGKPQVFAVDPSTNDARALTDAAEGTSAYEWAPDGRSLAYLTRDPVPDEERRRQQDMSFVTHADAPQPSTRLAVQAVGGTTAVRVLTPPTYYVESLAFSPDSQAIAFAASPAAGFMAQYMTRLYAVPAAVGDP